MVLSIDTINITVVYNHVTSLVLVMLSASILCCIMFKFQLKLKWGWQKPQHHLIQLGLLKYFFNEPEMPFKNVHRHCLGLEPLKKMVHIFLGQHWVTELNQLFAFGHLNAI
ncbi:hypothetical protein VPH35_095797 [Triticum aestivum]